MRRLLEVGVYQRAEITSNIKTEEREIMCQLKTIRYFLKYVV